jgi:hypothetical protein
MRARSVRPRPVTVRRQALWPIDAFTGSTRTRTPLIVGSLTSSRMGWLIRWARSAPGVLPGYSGIAIFIYSHLRRKSARNPRGLSGRSGFRQLGELGCYEPAARWTACSSLRQAKGTSGGSARVLAAPSPFAAYRRTRQGNGGLQRRARPFRSASPPGDTPSSTTCSNT